MDGREREGAAPAARRTASRARGRGLTFINTAHPSDALSRQALSNIRANVARDTHARGRRARAAVVQFGAGRGEPSSSAGGSSGDAVEWFFASPSRPGAEAQAGAGVVSDAEEPGTALAVVAAGGSSGSAAVAAPLTWVDPGGQSLAPLDSRPEPSLLNGFAWRWDPFQSFARPVSDTEAFLLDHYIHYSIENDRACCDEADVAMRAFLRGTLVPFALAAVLAQACRSILEVLPQRNRRVRGRVPATPTGAYYSRLMLQYRGLCVRSTNQSLSLKWPHVSDATITKSILMGAEERFAGNMDGWLVHACVISRMTEHRGGPARLGVSGFLSHCAAKWCIALARRFRDQNVHVAMRCDIA